MNSLYFYSTASDLTVVLKEIERARSINYFAAGNSYNSSVTSYSRCDQIPSLGVADRETGSACMSYLVLPSEYGLTTRTVMSNDARNIYIIDQLANPNSIMLTPAGIFDSNILLRGSVGTASEADISKQIFRLFKATICKWYRKFDKCYLGREAERLLNDGYRLTIARQSPPEYDLRRR